MVSPDISSSPLPADPMRAFDHPLARLDRVTLLSHALWSLAAEKMDLTDDDLVARMIEIDEHDGVRDQKVTVHPKRCDCGAMVSANPGWCMTCGERGDFSPFHSV